MDLHSIILIIPGYDISGVFTKSISADGDKEMFLGF